MILTRECDQDIVIVLEDGRQITVKVVSIRDNRQVRIGVDAPSSIMIHRREVMQRIREALKR